MNQVMSPLMSIGDAARLVPSGARVVIGGPSNSRRPLALLRALVRSGRRPSAVLAWAPCLAAERLLGLPVLVGTPDEIVNEDPQVFLLHAAAADDVGDVLLQDRPDYWYADRAIALATSVLIATVEQLVSSATVQRSPRDLLVRGELVSAIAHAPFGAHPLSYPDRYPADPQADVAGPVVEDHWEYLDAVGFARLLRRSSTVEGRPTYDELD